MRHAFHGNTVQNPAAPPNSVTSVPKWTSSPWMPDEPMAPVPSPTRDPRYSSGVRAARVSSHCREAPVSIKPGEIAAIRIPRRRSSARR